MPFRPLTAGEILLAQRLFRTSISYEKVMVSERRFFPLHPKGTGMAPNGHLYMPGCYRDDYAEGTLSAQAHFIHEMAHVWQRQNGIFTPVLEALKISLRFKFNYSCAYAYTLSANCDLMDYNMEQQASILQDYFLRALCRTTYDTGRCRNDGGWPQTRPLYEAVLKKFLADPAYARKRTPPPKPRHPP